MNSDTLIAITISGILLAAYAALVITALVQVFRNRVIKEWSRILWVIVIVMFPFLGSIAWFAIGHRTNVIEDAASDLRR